MTWKTIPTVTAPHYLDTNLNQVQKCVNWYHQKTADGFILCSLHGYSTAATTANNQACRGAIYALTSGGGNRIISVNGNTVYSVEPGGAPTSIGTLSTSSGAVVLAAGLSQVMIVDGTYGYYVNSALTTVTQITDVNFPSNPISCACFNGQFIAVKTLSDRWYMSAVDDASTWTPLISGRAITNGDPLLHVEAIRDTVYFIGNSSIEPWYASSVDPYLTPITGGVIPFGSSSYGYCSRLGDTLYLFGISRSNAPGIYALSSSGVEKISTPFIDSKIGDWSGPSRAYAYKNGGCEFYEVFDDSASAYPGWQYNATSGTWAEVPLNRGLYTVLNAFVTGQRPTAFSSTDGKIFLLGTDRVPANANISTAITRTLDFEVDAGENWVSVSGIRFEFEVQHDSSTDFTFSATLQKSDDGGRTFDTGITLSKSITNGTSAQKVLLQSPPLGSSKAGRIYRLTFAGPAARIILRRAEGLVRVGRF